MNIREYATRVDDLSSSITHQVEEVLKEAHARLSEISNTWRRELEAITADFCGNAPPDTVARAEMDASSLYQARHERH